jgi:hypothetical protein
MGKKEKILKSYWLKSEAEAKRIGQSEAEMNAIGCKSEAEAFFVKYLL